MKLPKRDNAIVGFGTLTCGVAQVKIMDKVENTDSSGAALGRGRLKILN